MGRWKAVATLGCALAAGFAQPAAAVERVQDGGFDAAVCTPTDCVSPVWAESAAGTPPIGPLCKGDTGDCANVMGTGFSSGPVWARLGAGVAARTSVAQTVPIPAAPAKFVFLLHITTSPNGTDTLTVSIDGTEVFRATDATPGYSGYKRVAIDASRFAGGARVIRFQGQNTATTAESDSFDVDGVSLDAPGPSPPPPPPPPNKDVDGDNYIDQAFGGPDCDGTNAAVHPGATDVPHDGIDQDCRGGDAPYPGLSAEASISTLFSPAFPQASKRYTRFKAFVLRGARVGATVTISCSLTHKRCPFRRKTLTVNSTKPLRLARYVKKAKLRNRTVVTIRVTAPGYIGQVLTYKVRWNARLGKTKRCLEPGQTTPQRHCS